MFCRFACEADPFLRRVLSQDPKVPVISSQNAAEESDAGPYFVSGSSLWSASSLQGSSESFEWVGN